jgi:hypothetical protein
MTFFLLAAVLLPALGVFPTAPTLLVFHTRDFGGKAYADVTVRSMDGKLRIEGFERVFIFTGKEWVSGRPVAQEDSGAVAFLAPFEPGASVARADPAGRPLVLVDVPAGSKKARVEYRYDATGLAAANVVFSDGTGYQFRRASADPATLFSSDFEPPKEIGPPPVAGLAAAGPRAADNAAVERLFAISIGEREQLDFERAGGVGRFRPRAPR